MVSNMLKANLMELINKEYVSSVLQPIIDISSQQPIGYEALTRGKPNEIFQQPEMMFQQANEFGLIIELEILCIKKSVEHFVKQNTDTFLFINICPASIVSTKNDFSKIINIFTENGLTPHQVVFEISELFQIEDRVQFFTRITQLKSLGFSIAIDDLGSGYSGLQLWSEIRPEYVKIDRHFIESIDQDLIKQTFVTSLVQLCEQLQCELIAEGVETVAELYTLRTLGIRIAQGYLLGKPQEKAAFSLLDLSQAQTGHGHASGVERPIGDLCQPLTSISVNTTMLEAEVLFRELTQLISLPVVQDQRPKGFLHRRKLMEAFALPYGRALYEKRSVKDFMLSDAIVVDAREKIESVSKRITDDEKEGLRQAVIVTQDGLYQGIAETKTLLRHITDSQIQKARYANPLTLLPGNVIIDEHLECLLRQDKTFYLLYLDLNHFKPYNDQYGYRQGDLVLQWFGQLLRGFISPFNFVGHIGGDDYVLVTEEHDIAPLCQKILDRFSLGCVDFHSFDDIERGYLNASDRDGNFGKIPLLSLAIGVVPSGLASDRDLQTLAQLAATAKKLAKQKQGNAWHCLNSDDNKESAPPKLAIVKI